jgi:hypothetical protein
MLSSFLAFMRSIRAQRANVAIAEQARNGRVCRLRGLSLADLIAERAALLSMKILVNQLPHQSPAERAGQAALQDRVDEVNAAIDARRGAEA